MMQRTGRRVALVTGGRRGIGLAVAEQLAVDGFDVAITGTRDDDAAQAAVAKLKSTGAAAIFIDSDFSVVSDHAHLLDTTEANFDAVLGVNLRGAFFLAQAVAKRMIARGKKDAGYTLIFISSSSAEMGALSRSEYCISKAGLAMVVEGFAVRLAAQGIAVFEVRPGIIRPDMTAGVAQKYDTLIGRGLVRS